MNREEMTLLGFEIVAYAGDARSKLLEALKAAENGDFAKADSLVVEAGSCIAEAHNSQTAMLAREASGEELPYSVTMMHEKDMMAIVHYLRTCIHCLLGSKFLVKIDNVAIRYFK